MALRGFLERQPSTAESLARFSIESVPKLAQTLAQSSASKQQQMQENENLKRLGFDVEGLSPELKKVFIEKALAQKQDSQSNLNTALSALDEMESLIKQPGIGKLGAWNPSDEARKNRGLFESLQASILPMFKQLFPRGMTQSEFQRIMNEWVPQAGDTESKIQGKIQGLRKLIISGEMPSIGEGIEKKSQKISKPKFNSEISEHRKKAEQLYKTYKDKKRVREILEKEFEF